MVFVGRGQFPYFMLICTSLTLLFVLFFSRPITAEEVSQSASSLTRLLLPMT